MFNSEYIRVELFEVNKLHDLESQIVIAALRCELVGLIEMLHVVCLLEQ